MWEVWKEYGKGSKPWFCQLIHSQQRFATKKQAQAMVDFVRNAHEQLTSSRNL